ncbi:MAG TPA: hypothetical protein DEA96_13505 [Leptospiraceae bacterium]|nr:hypothetical protein [Spirochaetaceae bacterium]HBS05978.1 hypothetical protein [Leptospiraceae bacterium]|tara:strand:+ start:23090 stop:23917 length:828 start_codon:yes stop_codon:yes gene_type:complete
MSIRRILCLGRSFTGGYLASEFPVKVRFLSRSDSDSLDGFEPDMILDTVPAVEEEGKLQNPLYRTEIASFQVPYVHISSTSVYPGSEKGLLEVDELSATGNSEKCMRRLLVEQAILEHRPDALIVRAGGLYGPGRSLPLFLAQGRGRFFERGDEIISRIHVHDLCRIVLAAGARVMDGEGSFPGFQREQLINAVDPNPSSVEETRAYLQEFYQKREIREALQKEGLQAPAEMPAPAKVPGQRLVKSRYAEQLIGRFRFPDFKAGFWDSMLRQRVG